MFRFGESPGISIFFTSPPILSQLVSFQLLFFSFFLGDTLETLIVRTCALDSYSLTMDTELVRIDRSCGIFEFEASADEKDKKRKLNGCITVCEDNDGCNGSDRSAPLTLTVVAVVTAAGVLLTVTSTSARTGRGARTDWATPG
jgi:hypothetical protein